MRIKVNRLSFLNKLSKCNKIVDSKSINVGIQGILINVTNEDITFTSSNNSISLKIKMKSGLEIYEVGCFLIKGKYLTEILRKMEDEFIELSNSEPTVLFVKGKNNELFLNLMDETNFPEIGFLENNESCEISSFEFKKAIQQTIISVDENYQKIVLQGLNFKIVNNSFYVFGADNFRISRKIVELENIYVEKAEANIPFKTALELTKIFEDQGNLKIIFDDSHVIFKNEEIVFQTTIIDGNYPDINKFYPTDYNSTIFVNKSKIIKLISRADIHSEESATTLINLILSDQKMIIKSNTQQIGTYEETFTDFELQGIDEQNILFNSKFMLDALSSFDTENVEINLIQNNKPIILTSNQDIRLSHIVLPVENK